MKRSERVQFHAEEAASYRAAAGTCPGTPAARECLASARDHEALAEAARVGDYPHSSEHITGTDY